MKSSDKCIKGRGIVRGIAGAALALTVIFSASWAQAATVSDVISLKSKGLSETVIMSSVEKGGLTGTLTADDLIALDRAGFSAASIQRMAELQSGTAPAAAPVVTSQPATPVSPQVTSTVASNPFLTSGTQTGSQVRVISYPQATGSVSVVSSGIVAPGVLSRTEMTVVNRTWRTMKVAVDGDSGVIYLRPCNGGEAGSLGPMQSVSLVVTAGEYMIVTDGISTANYFTVQPGVAEMMILGTTQNTPGYSFLITQAGRQYYAAGGLLQEQFSRKVIVVESGNGRHRKGKNRVVIKTVSIDPLAIFLRWGWNWPGHSRNHHRSKYDKHDSKHYSPGYPSRRW